MLLRSFSGEVLPPGTFPWAMCCKKGAFVSEGAADAAGHCDVGCDLDRMERGGKAVGDQTGLSESLNTLCLFQTCISRGQSSLSCVLLMDLSLRSCFHALQTRVATEVIWFELGKNRVLIMTVSSTCASQMQPSRGQKGTELFHICSEEQAILCFSSIPFSRLG